jgi:SAM-dependent methyltransferase
MSSKSEIPRSENTRELYDSQAGDWKRSEPVLLSDYSARPFVLNLCQPLKDAIVLDAGCGEGYVARKMLDAGAGQILGIDISEKMIEQAILQTPQESTEKCRFECADVLKDTVLPESRFDLVLAMFLFNYLDTAATGEVMRKFYHALKPGGHFVFSVPHPSLAFLKKDKFPFYFDTKGGYFSGRNLLFPGEIWRRDGLAVGVQCIHKTVEDYFSCLRLAGFNTLPEVYELHITEEHIALDPAFFTPLRDLPLHMAFKVKKA